MVLSSFTCSSFSPRFATLVQQRLAKNPTDPSGSFGAKFKRLAPSCALVDKTPDYNSNSAQSRFTTGFSTSSEAAKDSFASLIDRMQSSTEASTSGSSPSTSSRVGHIDVIMGPMFAGKTTALLDRVSELEARGLRVLLVKSCLDNRYAESSVATHDGHHRPCIALPRLLDLDAQLLSAHDAVAIDEAQFFPDLLQFAVRAAEVHHMTVVMAGLDGCFKRQKFGQMLDVVPIADSVRKLHARCAFCDRNALFSLRITADDRKEVVGGSDVYRPVCRSHYVAFSDLRDRYRAEAQEAKGKEGQADADASPQSPHTPV